MRLRYSFVLIVVRQMNEQCSAPGLITAGFRCLQGRSDRI